MNGQKNLLAIIVAVIVTVAVCYLFLPSQSSKQLEASYQTAVQQNSSYEKQIKSLEKEIEKLEGNVDYYKTKAEEAEAKAESKSGKGSGNSSGKGVGSGSSSGSSGKSDSYFSNDATYTYILNKNTGKFHYSWCSSVKQMKESNKIYSNSSRNDIMESGYSPCKKCKP